MSEGCAGNVYSCGETYAGIPAAKKRARERTSGKACMGCPIKPGTYVHLSVSSNRLTAGSFFPFFFLDVSKVGQWSLQFVPIVPEQAFFGESSKQSEFGVPSVGLEDLCAVRRA